MDPENVGTEAIVRVTHWLRGIWEMRRRGGPVQQWVDSIPSHNKTTEGTSQKQSNSDTERKNLTKDNNLLLKDTLLKKSKDMTATFPISVPNSPAITMTCPASSVPHNRLARDPSFQSDSSHCSSVESLLEWRKADPEAILLGLGFGYPSSPQENGSTARIPRRFLQPSKLKGIAVDEFLKQQQESSESLDTASLGYRGLTGSPYVAPSEIVQKIMERLREHESQEVECFTYTNNSSDLFGSMQQDGRLSVLSPDNRQYLERPRSKSPDMRNKRMIIGEKSFAFGYNGDLIEVDSLNKQERNHNGNLNDLQNNNSNDPKMELDPKLSTSTPIPKVEANVNRKSMITSGRRLAKQLSFDDDNSSYDSRDTLRNSEREDDINLVDQRIEEEQRDSLLTLVSRWSESVETATDSLHSFSQNDIQKTKANLVSRRASDSLCDSKLKTSPTTVEGRRMSDEGVRNKAQRFIEDRGQKKNKFALDKKPALKRQPRVSDVAEIDCEDVESSETLYTRCDELNDYVTQDETLCAGNITSNISEEFRPTNLETRDFSQKKNREEEKDLEGSCSNETEKCCRKDESEQICDHEETSTDCCCHASSSNCWKRMSKIMKDNRKLEDIVAKNKQEMAALRKMLNNLMLAKNEPGF